MAEDQGDRTTISFNIHANLDTSMATDVTTMSPNGQVVIPKKIRERLGLKAGEEFIAMDVEGRIVLTPARSEAIRTELEGILREFDKALGRQARDLDAVSLVRKVRDRGA